MSAAQVISRPRFEQFQRPPRMNVTGQRILAHLNEVSRLRAKAASDGPLSVMLASVKGFQHARFAATYADLLATPRYSRAARFFLDELYGPHDFSKRDAQFARVVPALVRLFPSDIVQTVADLAELHALSESLDMAMAQQLPQGDVAWPGYALAWQAVSQPDERELQIALMLKIGDALDRFTRRPLLRHSLRLMRTPAAAAGLGALQAFLESGFDTFSEMRGAQEFLATVAERERALAAGLFAGSFKA